MILLIFGVPGSGKGTQAKLLEQRNGFSHVSTGDLLRELKNQDNPDERTKHALDIMAEGGLVSDDFVFEISSRAVDKYADEGKRVIMDGVVRTVEQAKLFWDHFEKRGTADQVVAVMIELTEDEAFNRLSGRAKDSGRDDDTPEIHKARMESMGHAAHEPLLDFYKERGVLKTVDGHGNVEEVHELIVKAIKV